MTGEKILEAIQQYETLLQDRGVEPAKVPHRAVPQNQEEQLAHVCAMIPQMREFVAEGRLEKAFRWLGFVQGVLWANQIFILEDLKNHNRPTES